MDSAHSKEEEETHVIKKKKKTGLNKSLKYELPK